MFTYKSFAVWIDQAAGSIRPVGAYKKWKCQLGKKKSKIKNRIFILRFDFWFGFFFFRRQNFPSTKSPLQARTPSCWVYPPSLQGKCGQVPVHKSPAVGNRQAAGFIRPVVLVQNRGFDRSTALSPAGSLDPSCWVYPPGWFRTAPPVFCEFFLRVGCAPHTFSGRILF